MIAKESNNENQIVTPSWIGVRKIYKKLSDEFHILTRSFNIDIAKDTKLHLDHLIIAIDEIDNCIDELATKEERDSITASLITYLSNNQEKWNHPNESPTLSIKIQNLKSVVHYLKINKEFIGAAQTIFYNTEIKRHTKKIDELIHYIILEGEATAILPLSIMGIKKETEFGHFFTQLCMLMGIADLIIDARQDYKKAYIVFKPNLKLYYRLFLITVKDGIRLLLSIPRKIQFLKYCIRFTIALLKG